MTQPVAFVLLDDFVRPDADALADAVRKRHPDHRVEVTTGTAAAGADNSTIIRVGDHLVAVMSIPAPLPSDDDLWKRSQRSWPEARQALARHRGHLIVSALGTADERLPMARATTAIAGGLIAIMPRCSGAVWNAQVARSADIWLKMSGGAFEPFPKYPFMLWVEIVPFQTPSAVAAITVGLSSFVGREIEFEIEGMDLPNVIDRVAGLTNYLIEHGDVIKDGNTVGQSESERIIARHGSSRFNGSPVLVIGSQSKIPRQKKHYPIIPAPIARDHPLLIVLRAAALFDVAAPENQMEMLTDIYISEERLESYDKGIQGVLSNILQSDAFVEADQKVRRALASGDVETAKSILAPFAEDVRKFQMTARYALTKGDLFMFQPKRFPDDKRR